LSVAGVVNFFGQETVILHRRNPNSSEIRKQKRIPT